MNNIDGHGNQMGNDVSHTEKLLLRAANVGDAEEVERLIALPVFVCNPKIDSAALCVAAWRGHTKCVELLIPVSNPKHTNSIALCAAVERHNISCIDLLYHVSDPWAALQRMQKENRHNCETLGILQQRIEAEKLHQILTTEVAGSIQTQHTRKM